MMATDEREWELRWKEIEYGTWGRLVFADGNLLKDGEKIEVVPKARAVAAEQRVRELEAGWVNYDNSLERTLERAEQAEAKLATAVEALRKVKFSPVARAALAEIEGGENA